jgi:hypothetical protein
MSMQPHDFTPPEYVETHLVIFDKTTGEVLATETRWTDAGAESARGAELLESIAADSGRANDNVDVLEAKGPPAGLVRVDVVTRELIARPPRDVPRATRPPQLPRP